ncbi:MAG: hypothetical protein N2Z85_02070 [Patescibacteria group bacterium]|nr:hypothetical protein [Patescibacteria group bacterium]
MNEDFELQSLLQKIEKIEKVVSGFDAVEVGKWKDEVKEVMLIKNLYEHEIIKKLYEKFKAEVDNIDYILKTAYSDVLPDKKRDRMLAYKKACLLFLDIFNVDDNIQNIKRSVERNKHLYA